LLRKIKNDLNNVKVKIGTSSFEFVSKIVEILEDDITQRLKVKISIKNKD